MSTPSTSSKPWEHAKESGSETDSLALSFVESLSYDTRLYAADIQGSLAHAAMLCEVGLISRSDLAAIERGLGEIKREIESAPAGPTAVGTSGAWPGWKPELEDVHMCIESALIEKIGDPGRRLHTARSRNDQVALDLRLWLRGACAELGEALDALLQSLETIAESQGDVLLPTYTHVQRAQPGCVGAEMMAWHAMFRRDREALRRMADDPLGLGASPLGAGAVAGSLLPIDRAAAAKALGFAGVAVSSIDATASRDEALDTTALCARIAMHLSRLAEQWIMYCSTEFGFLALDPAHTTGSSMMPQKRNPDMLELVRGRSATIIGHHVAMLTLLKGLPLAYNRDLQEDKRHVFAAVDFALTCIRMTARVVAGARFMPERIAASGGGLARGYPDATALAEYFVSLGVPFRTAHQIVGALVRRADALGVFELSKVGLADFQQALRDAGQPGVAGKIDAALFESLGPSNVARKYRSLGHAGTGAGGYRDMLASARHERGETTLSAPVAPQTSHDGGTSRGSLFGDDPAPSERTTPAAHEALAKAYANAGRTLDDLPYTDEFERIFQDARAELGELTRREVFRRLHNMRKAGKLPALGKAASSPPKVSPEIEEFVREEVIRVCGSLGQRDQLPFTPEFDGFVERLHAKMGSALKPHEVWRLVAKIAK